MTRLRLLVPLAPLLFSGSADPGPAAPRGPLPGPMPGARASARSVAPAVRTSIGPGPRTAAADSVVRLRRESVAMGTRLLVTVEAPAREAALRATEAVLGAVGDAEALLSTWDPSSRLGRLNGAPVGEERRPPAELAALLAKAEGWARETGRTFEPAVGALVDAWDLRGRGRRPDPAELSAALEATGPGGVRIDPRAGTVVRRREGAWIDAGAFGKGAALAAVRRKVAEDAIRSAVVDLGGQVLALGAPADDPSGWPVDVAHPVERHRSVATLRLCSASAATSGASERGIRVDGGRLGHILDPRTGLPVPAWGSVTVVSPDPLEADVLATALFVLGPDSALDWARQRPDLAVLVLEARSTSPPASPSASPSDPPSDSRSEGVRARWTAAMERWLVHVPGSHRGGPAIPAQPGCPGHPASTRIRNERNHP